jgi:hypothetical protein
MPPTTIRELTVPIMKGSPIKGLNPMGRFENPALQKELTAWNTEAHTIVLVRTTGEALLMSNSG